MGGGTETSSKPLETPAPAGWQEAQEGRTHPQAGEVAAPSNKAETHEGEGQRPARGPSAPSPEAETNGDRHRRAPHRGRPEVQLH